MASVRSRITVYTFEGVIFSCPQAPGARACWKCAHQMYTIPASKDGGNKGISGSTMQYIKCVHTDWYCLDPDVRTYMFQHACNHDLLTYCLQLCTQATGGHWESRTQRTWPCVRSVLCSTRTLSLPQVLSLDRGWWQMPKRADHRLLTVQRFGWSHSGSARRCSARGQEAWTLYVRASVLGPASEAR